MVEGNMTVSYVSPANGATVPTGQALVITYTGDLLPWEFYVDGDLKFTSPHANLWEQSVTPILLEMPDDRWAPGQEYSWYVRYMSHCDDRTWNEETQEWEFSGNLAYETLDARTLTAGNIEKNTPINGANVTYGDTVTLDWTDYGTGATKYSWTLTYDHPIYGESFYSGTVNAPTTSKDVTSSIESIYDAGATECAWTLRPYVGGEYIPDYQDGWTINITGSAPSKPTTPSPAHQATEVDWSAKGLSWDDGGGADTYNVYFGLTGALELISSAQSETSITVSDGDIPFPEEGESGAAFYWRVDATNTGGTTEGDIWYFDARPVKASSPSPIDTYDAMTLDWMEFSWE